MANTATLVQAEIADLNDPNKPLTNIEKNQ